MGWVGLVCSVSEWVWEGLRHRRYLALRALCKVGEVLRVHKGGEQVVPNLPMSRHQNSG